MATALAEKLGIPPHLVPSQRTATIIAVATATAIAAPSIYLVAVRSSGLKRVRIHDRRPANLPTTLPEDVRLAVQNSDPSSTKATACTGPDAVIVSHQRLESAPIAVHSLRADLQVDEEGLDVILTPYVRATMGAWLHTAGGSAMRNVVAGLAAAANTQKNNKNAGNKDGTVAITGVNTAKDLNVRARSFDSDYLADCAFREGDLVNGIYRVAHRGESPDGGERIEFAITLPPSLIERNSGVPMHGVVIAGWEVLEPESVKEEEEGINLIFVNETWMWRTPRQKPTLIEGGFSRWWHAGVVGWMMGRGMDAVVSPLAMGKSVTAATATKDKSAGHHSVEKTPKKSAAVAGGSASSRVASDKQQPARSEDTETETDNTVSEEDD